MNNTIVDVIIPTYHRPELTLEAARSVLNQTYSDIHLYIIEDGMKEFSFNSIDLKKKIH